ncbi:MAG: hypothetical protein Q9213_000104 [Squamulea squamosa]
MSKAEGSPLQSAWLIPGVPGSRITQEQKAKIVFQLGAIIWQLSRLRFGQGGSIFEEDGEIKVKTCLSRGLLMEQRDELEDIPRGPFDTETDFFEAHITAFLEHVKYLPLAHHCFFAPVPALSDYESMSDYSAAVDLWNNFVAVKSKIDGSHNRTDFVIVGEAFQYMLAEWTHRLSGYFAKEDRHRFVLHHPDLSVNNIYVDQDFNITCIIDWAFCSAIPLTMLLVPPGLPQPRNELDDSLLPTFEDGFRQAFGGNLEASSKEYMLSWVLSRNRPMWLFTQLLYLGSETDYILFKALWDATGSCDQGGFFRSMQSSEKYVSLQRELAEDDPTAQEMNRKEKRCLGDDVQGLAISRKLTMVSEWSSRYNLAYQQGIRRNGSIFVADKRLWKWIACCLKGSSGGLEADSVHEGTSQSNP